MMRKSQSTTKSLKERISLLDRKSRKRLLEKLENGNVRKQLSSFSATLEKAEPLFTETGVTSNGVEEEVKVFPVSHTQERMFFLHEFEENSPAYSSPMAFQFEGLIDFDKLKEAFKAVVRRHASLRTTFYMDEVGLYQRVHTDANFEFNRCSVSQSADKSEKEVLSELLSELVNEHFDLEKGPLLRAHFIDCESGGAVLLIIIHHIISDGWSRANLCNELSVHYNSSFQVGSIDNTETLLQYADFATWQNEYLKRDDFKDHLDYWKEKLSGKLDPIDLCVDFKRPKKLSSKGAELIRGIDTSLIEKLKQRASEQGGTLYMILLAAFNVLLHHYSGQKEIIIGTQVANRHRKEVEGLIGCFMNTLAIRTDLSGAPNFNQLFKRVKKVCLDAFTHQEVPFERLLGELEIDRNTGRNPVFQTLFSLQDFEEVNLSLGGCHSTAIPVCTNTSKVELHLLVQPSKDGWSCVVEYNTDLFSSDSIERLIGHWNVLLNAIAENPEISIVNIPLLTDSEKEALLHQWNDTVRDYPLDTCVHNHFEDQVDRTPDAIAVVFEGKSLSYKDLNSESNKLAHRLLDLGVGPEKLVGLLNNRSIEMFVGLLAVLKAGGAYVPIDLDLPSNRIKELVDDAGIKLLLTNEGEEGLSEFLKIPVLLIRNDEVSENYSSENPISSVDSRNLAYVLYTSGSTGNPKGVTVEHRQIVNYIFGVSEICDLTAGNFAMIQPLTVDSTQTMLFPAWLCGGTIHLISKMDSLDAVTFKNYISKHSIDYLKIAPTHLMALLAGVRTVDLLPNQGLFMGGEELPSILIEDIKLLGATCRIWNHYGPTETTVGVLLNEIKFQYDAFHSSNGTIPLGRPLPNTIAHIVNAKGELVPLGLRGEILIGGDSVSRGYLDREDLTNSVFQKSSVGGPLNRRLYKTGDFGRRLPDGKIEYLGRADGQIKIRGYRVELGEIESVLRGHPEVIDAKVLATKDNLDSLKLVAFSVLSVGATETTRSLMVYLSENLPPQMVPAGIHIIDSMPRSGYGKVDAQKLLSIPRAGQLERDFIPDSNLTLLEKALKDIWIDVLGTVSINPSQNFFEIGGNSLTATLVIARLRQLLNVEIPVREFFNNPTIGGIAEHINREFGELEIIQAFSPGKISETQCDLSCIVIGDGRMPIEVIGILRRNGVRICGISTTDPAILNWAAGEGIKAVGPEVEIKTFLESEPFDYLFSVVNPRILKEDVLALPRKMAINFHDGPLPRYAGVNAPSWAIINQQTGHGVTWHAIVPEIDAGDILKQVTFSLSDEETFLSLGLKCVEEGLNALGELLKDIKSDTLRRKKQDIGLRTYFKAIDRPTPVSTLLWEKTAEELDAMRRGQDFGPLFNSMGTIKLFLGDAFLIVEELEVVNERCDNTPGSILSIDSSTLKVATSNKPIRIRELYTIDGERIMIDHLVDFYELKVGSVLPSLNKVQSLRSINASNAIIRNDGYWRKRLVDLRPVSFQKLNSVYRGIEEHSTTSNSKFIKICTELPLSGKDEVAARINYLIAAWCAFVARVGGDDVFDIEFYPIKNYIKWNEDSSLVSPYIPLRVSAEMDESFSQFQRTLNAELSNLESHSVFGRDLVFRDPKLLVQDNLRKLHKLSIAVWHVPEIGDEVSIDGLECVLLLDEKGENVSLVYNEESINTQLAENLVKWFSLFLEDLAGNEESRIDSIRLLSVDDSENLSEYGHGETFDFPINTPISRIFEKRVLEEPDAIAVEQGDSRISYEQLNSLSNSLAHLLIEKGVQPDTQVGICLERSPEMVVSILAVLKAGGAYLPLDPKYPKERLSYLIHDSSVEIILTSSGQTPSIPTTKAELFLIDLHELKTGCVGNPGIEVSTNNLAYTIYTSGSTGNPKGVQIEHRSLVNYIFSIIRLSEVSRVDRILQFSSLNFDASAEEIYCALFSGATLVLKTEEMLTTHRHFIEFLEQYRITLISLPTAYWHSWVGAMKTDMLRFPTELRTVLIGGEPASVESISHWQLLAGTKLKLINSYGPTETTIGATWFDLSNFDCKEQDEIPIGVPVHNLKAYVMDSNNHLMPDGVVGELCLGGACLARGYYAKPDLTSEKFVHNPFGNNSNERIYKTGDRVRRNGNGDLVYLGRMDQQIKIRGFRIELGEIEGCILRHPSVKESVVTVVETESGDKQLAAYFVSDKSGVSDQDLRHHVVSHLPEFMVPLYFTALEKLPTTGSGKVDRKALPEPVMVRSDLKDTQAKTLSSTEKIIASIWAEILKIGNVGLDENFFQLGGHSLIASRVISRIKEELKVNVSLRTFFEIPSVGQLSAYVESELNDSSVIIEDALEQEENRFSLSYAQQRLWFLDRLKGGSPEYNIPKTYLLKGNVDKDILEKAINRIINRHEILRTYFGESLGIAYQVVVPNFSIEIATKDLRRIPVIEQNSIIRKEGGIDFDLEKLPLIRVCLFHIQSEEFVLLLNTHHIVSDGWSSGVFNRELSANYNALLAGEENPLPPLELQYSEYSIEQTERFQGDLLEEQLGFWRNYLKNPTNLNLSTDRPRPANSTFTGASHSFEIGPDLCTVLNAFNRSAHVTPFMSLISAFQLLLARYSGQDDIIIGTPFANRMHIQEESMIGFFVNTLVMRGDFSGNRSFKELVADMRDASIDAFQYHELPFEKLVEEINPSRDPSRHPIFQVMFVLQNTNVEIPDLFGLDVSPLRLEGQSSHFDLSLELTFEDDRYLGRFAYNTDLFYPDTIKRYADHFVSLLDSLVRNPETPVKEIPWHSREEELKQIEGIEDIHGLYSIKETIHELFEAEVEKHPREIAIKMAGESITYDELNKRANKLSNYLHDSGVKPGEIVGLCLERSIEFVVGILGVLKAGGAYLPLDLSYPIGRLKYMVCDAKLSFVVTTKSLNKIVSEFNSKPIFIDSEELENCSELLKYSERKQKADDLAYVIYTSGSTGKPKGVEVTHNNVVRLFKSTEEWFSFDHNDVWSLFHSFAFDFSVWEIFGALLHGGRLIIVPYEISRSPERFYKLLVSEKVTVLNQTPSAFRQLLSLEENLSQPSLLSLRYIVFGGEALDFDILKEWFDVHGDQKPKLINMYGITETTVHVSYRPIFKDDLSQGSLIGVPIPDMRMILLDSSMLPVPIGVPGEIYVGGAGLAKGYLNRPELTSERFLDIKLLGDKNVRLYRTGDLARRLEGGEIDYIGRIDHQVQLRGFRIELGEIESALTSHSSVRETRVVLREDLPGDKRLTAYVIVENEVNLSVLRGHLERSLPDYMIPAHLVFIESFPLTPNGKTDFKALPIPKISRELLDRPLVLPRNETEKILANIWMEILDLDEVSIEDDFFELGGHSLVAAKVISRIKRYLNKDILLRDIFDYSTVSSLANYLVHSDQNPNAFEKLNEEIYPASFSQQRIWFLNELKGSSSEYNISKSFLLKGEVHLVAFEEALNRIIHRHQSLRTYFQDSDGVSNQVVVPSLSLKIAQLDFCDKSPEELKQYLKEESAKPFDLSKLPLARAQLLHVGKDEYVFFFLIHHIVSDGWSLGVFFEEFTGLYNTFRKGKPDPIPPLAIHYTDYSQWQRDWFKGDVLEEQVKYWKEQLDGNTTLEIPTDRPRPLIQTYNGAKYSMEIPLELNKKLNLFNRQERVTPFMSLMAAFQAVLSHYCGQKDISIGTPIANRQQVEHEAIIGFFVNTLVIRSTLSNDSSFRELVKQVREISLDAFQHQDLPFEKLVESLNPARDQGRHPLFQVMFAMQNAGGAPPSFDGLEVSDFPIESTTTHFDIELHFFRRNNALAGLFYYNVDLFNEETIKRLSDCLLSVLEMMLDDPDCPLSGFELLNKEERDLQLYTWNDTQKLYDETILVHQLFESIAGTQPELAAVRFGGNSLSYGELNARANQLANRLQQTAVAPDVPVGILLERSLDSIVAILAVGKSGGVCLPIDPTYPDDRILHIIDDAKPAVMISQKSFKNMLPDSFSGVLFLEDRESFSASEENCGSISSLQNLAYLLYTSGSTGRPKGVKVTHRTLSNLINWQLGDSKSGVGDRTLQFASFNFDVSFQEIYSTLASGGELIIASEEERQDLNLLSDIIRNESVSRIFLPFVALDTLAQTLNILGEYNLPLKEVITAGEQLIITPAIRTMFNELEGAVLLNHYGPTETHVVTSYSLSGDPAGWPSLPAIGKPIQNTRIYIVNEKLLPVPVGVHGEILIGGDPVASGYLNATELTNERFIASPWVDGDTLYRTGDIGRYLADGNIEFIGRLDDQVKIRGFRVELGEVESCLAQCEGVLECAVIVREDAPGDKRLVAYYVPTQLEAPPSLHDLRAHVRKMLPDYMVPTAFVLLEKLPLSFNLKVDRKSLPNPESDFDSRTDQIVVPETEMEKRMAVVWTKILKLEQIGIDDNFFELGGHSLLATQMVARMKRELQLDVSISMLFDNPTIRELAQKASVSNTDPVIKDNVEVSEIPDVQEFPLSFAQQQMWFLDKLEGGSREYILGDSLRLKGKLDIDALKRAIQEIVSRHQTLRTILIEEDGIPKQRVFKDFSIDFPVEDFSHLDSGKKEELIKATVDQEYGRPFQLLDGPLLRMKLLILSQEEHALYIFFHHIITDGWSMQVFHRELSFLYESFKDSIEPSLPPLRFQYSDFVENEIQSLQGKELVNLETYWKNKMMGAPPLLTLPTDKPRKEGSANDGAIEVLELSSELSQSFSAFCNEQQSTLYMSLIACFRLLLSRLSGQDDVVVGCPIAGRNMEALEDLIGMFVGTLALRTDLSGNPSFIELLKRERITTLEAYDNQSLPFEKVVDLVNHERTLAHTPVFQVFLNLINLENTSLKLSELEVESLKLSEVQAKFDITLYVIERDDKIWIRAVYKKALFLSETIQQMLRQLEYLIEQVVENPNRPIQEYSLATKDSKELLPDPGEIIEEGAQCAVSNQFLERVKQNPESTAIRQSGRSWSYRELGNSSLQVANQLKQLGAKPGDVVVVSGSKSFGLMASLIGVFCNRCVLLLLDPSLPLARKELMLNEAGGKYWIRVGEDLEVNEGWGDSFNNVSTVRITNEGLCPDFQNDWLLRSEDFPPPDQNDKAYIFFTSGSSGTPKAVLGTHKGLSQFLDWERETLGVTEADRVAQLTVLSFDVVLRDIFLPLTSGATLCLPGSEVEVRSGSVISWLMSEGITIIHTVPSLVQSWLESLDSEMSLPSLRWMLLVGEPLSKDLINLWRSRIENDAQIINLYGTTETAMAKSWYVVPDVLTHGIQPIGRALPGAQLLILGPEDKLCGLGEPGEIAIRSPFSTSGYLKDSYSGRNGFTTNPFREDESDIIYRTGDRGAYNSQGQVVIYGRDDDQVKIRGVRIEPGEVEFALKKHPEIETCHVIGQKDANGDNCLVAYIVAPSNPSIETLYNFLLLSLPQRMIPSGFVILPEVPLTPSGKLDRQALPSHEEYRFNLDAEFVAPKGELEEGLASIFCSLLALDTVGVNENFFHLGGNSLMVIRLCYRVNKEIGKNLSVAHVFKYPTIVQLAEFIENNADQSHYVMEFAGSGEKTPFFFIPGITRNALVFRDLAQLIGVDRVCYGLELPMPQNDEEPLKSLEELGAHCAEQIRSVQPLGPYNLAGYSFGGLLAYETARQLCRPDEPRPNVVLFDSRHRLPIKHTLSKRLKWGLRLFSKEKYKYIRYVLKELGYNLGNKIGLKYHSPALIPIELLTGGIRPIMASTFHYSYDPDPSPLNILLFTVRDTEYSITSGNDLKRWNDYSDREVTYYRIESDYHNQILDEKHLETITGKIRELIGDE